MPTDLNDCYFGACPHCHETDGCLNVQSTHWFVCDKHKVAWCIGSNLFSSWQDETKEDWERNAAKLDSYEEVKPVYPCYACN